MDTFQRRATAFTNEMRRSCGALLGIIQGILSDQHLNDQEVNFLRDWLTNNKAISTAWPGDVVLAQVQQILADGIITEEERIHLAGVLQNLVGGKLEELAEATHVTALALDQVEGIDFPERRFCLTGEFVFGPRSTCEQAIALRGGLVQAGITKKLDYVIIGGLGSPEWKHGSFGTKIEKAIEYKRSGLPILLIHEDAWAAALSQGK